MPQVFVVLAGLIHVYIFVMESLLWGTPRINRVFGVSDERAKECRLFAFNQGFYNLFLAVAALLGVALSFTGYSTVALTLMAYSCLSMFGASIALLYSERKAVRPALIQGLPPLAALALLLLFS